MKTDPERRAYGLKLKEIRALKKFTQEQVAEALAVSVTAVNKWAMGRSTPKRGNAEKLAELYGISVHEIESPDEFMTFKNHKSQRFHYLETVVFPERLNLYVDFIEDNLCGVYQAWMHDDLAWDKKLVASADKKYLDYETFKECVLTEPRYADEYRKFIRSILNDSDEDKEVEEQLDLKEQFEKDGFGGPNYISNSGRIHFNEDIESD